MTKVKIFYVTYYFPPIHSIAVERNYHLAASLAKIMHEKVSVFTTSNRRIFPKQNKSIDFFKVYELFTFDYRTIISIIFPRKQTIHFAEEEKGSIFLKFLIKVNESFPFNVFLGEGGILYIIHGFWKLLWKVNNCSCKKIIITSYRPTSNIIIGYLFKCLKSDITWVINFHDIPIQPKRQNVIMPRLQHKFWKKMVAKADHIVAVSAGVGASLERYGKKSEIVTNGVNLRQPVSASNKKFTFLFTGSLYKGLIEPDYFFNLVSEMVNEGSLSAPDLSIIYAGKDNQMWFEQVEKYTNLLECVKMYGVISHNDSILLQQSANVNLLLTWSDAETKGTLTGKFYEYLGARNPILCIVNGQTDTNINNAFGELECGKVIYGNELDDLYKAKQFISMLYWSWRDKKFENQYLKIEKLQNHTWEKRAEQLIGALHNFK